MIAFPVTAVAQSDAAVVHDGGAGGTRDASQPRDVREAHETADAAVSTASPSTPVSLLPSSAEDAEPVAWWQRLCSFLGLFGLVALAWLISSHKRSVPWRIIAWGIGLQLAFGVFVLKTSVGLALFSFMNDAVIKILEFTAEGSRFIFGDYLDAKFTVALHVLPTIVFFSALMNVLYHLGVMQKVVHAIAWVMSRTMRTSGAETLSTAANIFVGQTEAPLVVKPFVATMTQSELMAIMVGGFATVAGGVLAAYVGMLKDHFPDIAGHLIAASVMAAPATLLVAKVILPEKETPETAGVVKTDLEKIDANIIDAAARGASEGLQLALNVAAMLLVFIALVALVNFLIGLPFEWLNAAQGREVISPPTLQQLFGYVFWPLAFLMGIPPSECSTIGSLLGVRMVLNEFVAYVQLADLLKDGAVLSHRTAVIATYALCGFANFGSIGIQIGGIGGMAPDRRSDLARLGLRAMLGGTIATCMTAAVAGVLL